MRKCNRNVNSAAQRKSERGGLGRLVTQEKHELGKLKSRGISRMSVGAILALALVLMNPVIKSDVVLAVASSDGDASTIDGTKVDLSTGGEATASSVKITMGAATENGILNAGSADPNKSAGLVKRTASVEIGMTDGYTVTLSGNADLTGVNSSNKIPTVTTNTTLAQMNNQWGWYSVEGDVDCSALQSYKQMKPTGEVMASGMLKTATTKRFTMCFGAKVNGDQAADTYSNTVTLSVVAQPYVVATFDGITTMQEMTADICKRAEVNDTAYLKDTRDGKSYWVTRLLDGNCWMSQNLAYDMSGIRTIVALGAATDSGASSDDNYESYSWTAGEYVIKDPVATQACANNSVGLSGCAAFVQVGSRTPAKDPNFYRLEMYAGTDGSTCTKPANTTVSTATSGVCAQYDAHYLVGNYYSFSAAADICPTGWVRAKSGAYNDGVAGSFYYLLNKYGVYASLTGAANGVSYNIAKSPLFFVRAGKVGSRNNSALGDAGSSGQYWSSAESSMGFRYALTIGDSSVNPSDSGAAGRNGRSLRCLVVGIGGGGVWDV